MANPLLSEILGSVFSGAMQGRAQSGPFGAGPSAGGLGGLLGGLLGGGGGGGSGNGGGIGDIIRGALPGGNAPENGRDGGLLGGNRGMLMAMLLPVAMQWVQRNGGVGAVLERFRQKGYGQHADSWVSTGANQVLDTDGIGAVVGGEELSRLSQQLGIPQQEVARGFAEILPEMVNQLSPQGEVPAEADSALDAGQSQLQRVLDELGLKARG